MSTLTYRKGFTLIEVVIYLALLGVLMSGVLVSTYPLMVHTSTLTHHVLVSSEIAFVSEKIGALLSTIVTDPTVTITSPAPGDTASELRIEHNGTLLLSLNEDTSLTFCTPPRSCGTLTLQTLDQPVQPLINERVVIRDVRIVHVPPTADHGRLLLVSFSANGKHVGPLRYDIRF